MIVPSLFLFIILLPSIDGEEKIDQLSKGVHDISCFIGICVVAEGCEGNPIWRRVLKWPTWETKPNVCLHAFMIRRNIGSILEKDKDLKEYLDRKGEEYLIVMMSGGPEGPAREMRMETNRLKPIFALSHEGMKTFDTSKIIGMKWNVDSYDYQTVNDNRFEAGVMTRIKNVSEYRGTDYCIFIHSSRSMQHLCGGLERLFERIPSHRFPMRHEECGDNLTAGFEIDNKSGFLKCKKDEGKNEDFVLKTSRTEMKYVHMHYAFCRAGKTFYLVEHHVQGMLALHYETPTEVRCGDLIKIDDRCAVPEVPEDVHDYCGDRCDKGGKTVNPNDNQKPMILRCDFMDSVIDGKRYKKEVAPEVTCDATGWWKYTEPGQDGNFSKWITSMFCFFPQSDVYSDCVLDRFECGEYGECPFHRQHQVDCDGNTEGLVLAVFHPGYENGYTQVKKLGCDSRNGWWTVNGKSLPAAAAVACVWPMELEIMRRAAIVKPWDPDHVERRALSNVGPTVRNAAVVVAIMSILVVVIGIIIVNARLEGPKTRIVTRQLRSLYPSLLNEEHRLDAAKAELEYKSVDCDAAGLALHHFNKQLEGDNHPQLHNYWTSLSWPKRNLLLERTLLHRAYFGLKVLYDRFHVPDSGPQAFDQIRPGLKEKIVKAGKVYKSLIEKWPSNDLTYSLAFATLSKAELDAFRRNEVKRKTIRSPPLKETSAMSVVATDAPDGTDPSKKIPTEAKTPVAKTAVAPTLDETGTGTATATAGVSTGKEKMEETTAPPPEKE